MIAIRDPIRVISPAGLVKGKASTKVCLSVKMSVGSVDPIVNQGNEDRVKTLVRSNFLRRWLSNHLKGSLEVIHALHPALLVHIPRLAATVTLIKLGWGLYSSMVYLWNGYLYLARRNLFSLA